MLRKPLLTMLGRGFLNVHTRHYSMSMHEVVVNAMTIAVNTVIRMLSILLQRVLFSMIDK